MGASPNGPEAGDEARRPVPGMRRQLAISAFQKNGHGIGT